MTRRRLRLAAFILTSPMLAGIVILNAPGTHAQTPQRTARPQRPVPASPATEKTGLKGILEPVNYGQDVKLTDMFFTSVDEGWVSGEHATILHTADGGKTWTAQVGGDPNNQEHPIRNLRFLDAKRGWAVQSCAGVCAEGDRLLRTGDGQNWEEIGALPRGAADFVFTSSGHGIALTNGSPGYSRGAIFLTEDSGKTWKPLTECTMSTTVNGLAHTDGCWFVRLEMLSNRTGYALACDNNDSLAFFHTDDAGRTWNYRVLPFNAGGCREADFFFTDASHGVLVFKEGKTYITNDGSNWTAMLATTLGPQIRFADPQIGWTLWSSPSNWRAARISYTTDGGQHWKASGDIDLPLHNGDEYRFAFPRRDRAYIIGNHGMVYRYRIVPASYTAANTFSAPVMPGFDTSALTAAASRVRQDIAALQARIAAASGMPVAAASSTPAQPTPPEGSGSGGFTQDTPAVATASAGSAIAFDPTNANLTQGFSQSVDTSAASAPLEACCGPALQNLQTDLTSFNQAAAVNSSQFRSLNLAMAGFQLVTNLLNQARQLRDSFSALKHAPNLQAASAALQQFSTNASFTQQTVSTGFQDPGTWYATPSPAGGFVQDTTQPPNP
jgi:photosystem II stability/assembly factor-like uncharacterized protein